MELANGEFIIELKDLKFKAYHGLYPEERKTGGEFVVDLSVTYRAPGFHIQKIGETINYESLFMIVKTSMEQPHDLLETIAMEVIHQIQEQFSQVKEATIRIIKKNPPIDNFSGDVAVTYRKQF